MTRPKSWVPWVRRVVQCAFLALFVFLFLNTRFRKEPLPNELLQGFFLFDPLVLLATFLASWAVPIAALWALVTLVVTLLFGRVFCGWVCPLGTINHFVGWLRKPVRGLGVQTEEWSPWQRAKYLILVALIVMSLFGVHWIGVFDPFSVLYRSMSTAVMPAAQYAVKDASTAIFQADPHIGSFRATSVSVPIYKFLRDNVFMAPPQVFLGGGFILFLFLGIVALNLYKPRFWCRYVCPLGALLGLVSRRPLLLRLAKDKEQCNDCGRCTIGCQGVAAPGHGGDWIASECFACWNCVPKCNWKALGFKLDQPLRKRPIRDVDLGRRAILSATAGGVAGVFLMRNNPQARGEVYNPSLIRSPGALPETEFLQKCLQCGLCMKVCPTNGLQPAALQAGLEGVWTPVLVPKIGCCEYDCNLCGQVCPTGAIQPLTIEQKHEVKIGLASFDTTRCIPYAYGRDCGVCEEHCPVPSKAIYFVDTEIVGRNGMKTTVKQPRVDVNMCIGCGICETVCPFIDKAGIRVTSANESRHPDNQPVLPDLTYEFDGESGQSDPYGG